MRGLQPIRLAISLVLLLIVFWAVDAREVTSRLGEMRLSWVALAALISVAQICGSAWRWRFTAARLGIELPFGHALREYYLATFLNQILPGGVMGDVSRAWRHARSRGSGDTGPVVRAVILERASGQAVMAIVATVSAVSVLLTLGVEPRLVLCAVAVLGGGVALLLLWLRRRPHASDTLAGRVWHDTYAALFTGSAFAIQLVSSVLIVASYLLTYLVAARAVGVETQVLTLLPLVAPVLVTMLLPVTVAGWGVREGAAAALWSSIGLTAVEGVVVSIGYGLLVLLTSLPGAVVLFWQLLAGPSGRKS